MTRTEFLFARIAEDDAEAAGWRDDGPWGPHPDGGYWVDPHGHPIYAPRARVLAECAAKRRIVERITEGCGHPWVSDDGATRRWLGGWCLDCDQTLQDLADIYAGHPDYREEWKP